MSNKSSIYLEFWANFRLAIIIVVIVAVLTGAEAWVTYAAPVI
jgi:hypothetical protein